MIFKSRTGVDLMITETVKIHTSARHAAAIQNESGKTKFCKGLQTSVNFPVHGIIPGKLSWNIVKLGTAVNIIDERPGVRSFLKIRSEEKAVELCFSVCCSKRDPLRNLIAEF